MPIKIVELPEAMWNKEPDGYGKLFGADNRGRKLPYADVRPFFHPSLYQGLLDSALSRIARSSKVGNRIVDNAVRRSLSVYVGPGLSGGYWPIDDDTKAIGINYQVIGWDPFMDFIFYASSSVTSSNFVISRSPSWVVLGHELGHFEADVANHDNFMEKIVDKSEKLRWGNLEDKRNILEIEHKIADSLKVGKRWIYPSGTVPLRNTRSYRAKYPTGKAIRKTILGRGSGDSDPPGVFDQQSPSWESFINGLTTPEGIKARRAAAKIATLNKYNTTCLFMMSTRGGSSALTTHQMRDAKPFNQGRVPKAKPVNYNIPKKTMQITEVYPGTVYFVSEGTGGTKGAPDPTRFLKACNILTPNDAGLVPLPENVVADFKHAVNASNSPHANALVEYFKTNSQKLFVFFGDREDMPTAPMTAAMVVDKQGTLPANRLGIYYNSQEERVPKISAAPTPSTSVVPDAVDFSPVMTILHEFGHLWQLHKKKIWYETEVNWYETEVQIGMEKKNRQFWSGQGMLTLDYNNLENWEWPICRQLGYPVRMYYHLLQPTADLAKAARQRSLTLVGNKKTLFLTRKFDATTKKWVPIGFNPRAGWENQQPTNGL
jgi:hypothetical protein